MFNNITYTSKRGIIDMYRNRVELIKLNWTLALAKENFLLKFSANAIICFVLCILLVLYLFMNRFRNGVILDDPILNLLHPLNFSGFIFFFMYSGLLLFLYYAIPQPLLIIYAARAFTALFALRVLFVVLTPLAPPQDMIMLHDPFMDKFVGFKGEVVNDLFFSGHVANLYLFAFCCKRGWLKSYIFAAAGLVSVMIVCQKVHYTADVFAAPFFSYVCYAGFVKNKLAEFYP